MTTQIFSVTSYQTTAEMSLVDYDYDPGEEEEILNIAGATVSVQPSSERSQEGTPALGVDDLISGVPAIQSQLTEEGPLVQSTVLSPFASSTRLSLPKNFASALSTAISGLSYFDAPSYGEEEESSLYGYPPLRSDDDILSTSQKEECDPISKCLLMPKIPTVAPSRCILDQIKRLQEYQKIGTTVNSNIAEWLEFKNPYLLEKIMNLFDIYAYSSNYPQEIFNPREVPQAENTYEALVKRQNEVSRAALQNKRAERSPSAAHPPSEPPPLPSVKPRSSRFQSKWDNHLPMPSKS
ncbi:HCNGP family protein [Cardiosporidium cionae]|uniref:HCNGP family protein n=1 Tax=Cardiosporidium cionae TaxID=476202 RepID=A0ABQ7J596_9APIC|nr:HCNGP family protein [Cardiosporidium cionae]|eukprot:KAF8819143.1 HCNGP family protein [Cardiosporidium cionae]